MSFLTDNQLFCMEQFGFRPGHSTELAALRLVDHLTNEMDNFNVPINILYCIVLYCIMRPYTDGPIGPLSYRHSSGVVRNPHSALAE